jgi:hypothetical protein
LCKICTSLRQRANKTVNYKGISPGSYNYQQWIVGEGFGQKLTSVLTALFHWYLAKWFSMFARSFQVNFRRNIFRGFDIVGIGNAYTESACFEKTIPPEWSLRL